MNTVAVYSTSYKLHPEFLYLYCCSKNFAKLILVGTIPQIRAKDVLECEIPLHLMGLQQEFAAIVRQTDKSKFELKRAIETIDPTIKNLING